MSTLNLNSIYQSEKPKLLPIRLVKLGKLSLIMADCNADTLTDWINKPGIIQWLNLHIQFLIEFNEFINYNH